MKRILLKIAYDGTNYFGWQKQKNTEIVTVEGELEKAFRKLFHKDDLECIGASRTDRGVHALGQRAVIDVETTIPTERIPLAIRSLLPEDIVVTAAEEVFAQFHPRYDCIKKTYEYQILNTKYRNPLFRNYSEFVPEKLDILKMERGAKAFIGTYDFQAFCAAGSSVTSTVRSIFDCSVERQGDFVVLRVTGNGFLYNMVRIIAGTLIFVGQGKIAPEEIPFIIESRDRARAGKTAGPQGLKLMEIYYDCEGKSIDSRRGL